MTFEFISDLDDYFAEKYSDYDRLCVMEGYEMPVMQGVKILADGREYAYTLPAKTMRLSTQKNKTAILQKLKTEFYDITFSFTVRPLSIFERIRLNSKKTAFKKVFAEMLAHYNLTPEQALENIEIDEYSKKNLLNGKYYPTKNLIFSVALACGVSLQDTERLMEVCSFGWDFKSPKDVVVAYLVKNGIYNPAMMQAAFDEYKVDNLFIKD